VRYVVASIAAALSVQAFHAASGPLTATARHELIASHHWYSKCPVPFSGLRLLTLTYWGWDGRVHTGQLVTNASSVAPLTAVFEKLYAMRFPVPSPCTGGTGTGSWSMHAYGEAIDINPIENPYVGCGQTRDPVSVSFMKRTPLRKGMVTPAVYAAFHSVGWGWGGSWYGSTKDYMHFSANGH